MTINANPQLHQWEAQETRYFDREWSEEEVRLFDQSIKAQGGAELRAVQKDVKTRTVYEVVRHYYTKWKR